MVNFPVAVRSSTASAKILFISYYKGQKIGREKNTKES